VLDKYYSNMPYCFPAHMRSTTLGSRHIEFPVHQRESYDGERPALVGFDALLREASGLPSVSAALREVDVPPLVTTVLSRRWMESSPLAMLPG
jgi:hypothetical protein